MKRYFVVDWKSGDSFEEAFETKSDAINRADYEWNCLTKKEKEQREMFCVMYAEIDEDGCIDYNTAEMVQNYK